MLKELDPRERICYYDKNGVEIREGDLLKVFHFRHYIRKEKMYMYHIAILQEFKGMFWWAGKEYFIEGEKGHYWLKACADKETGIMPECEIIDSQDWESRERLKKEAKQRIKKSPAKRPGT